MNKGWDWDGMIAKENNGFCLGDRSVIKKVIVDSKTGEVMAT